MKRKKNKSDQSLGEFIKERREALKMSQKELAMILKISCCYFSRIETGQRVFPCEKVSKLATVLKVSEDEILTRNFTKASIVSEGIVTCRLHRFFGLLKQLSLQDQRQILEQAISIARFAVTHTRNNRAGSR